MEKKISNIISILCQDHPNMNIKIIFCSLSPAKVSSISLPIEYDHFSHNTSPSLQTINRQKGCKRKPPLFLIVRCRQTNRPTNTCNVNFSSSIDPMGNPIVLQFEHSKQKKKIITQSDPFVLFQVIRSIFEIQFCTCFVFQCIDMRNAVTLGIIFFFLTLSRLCVWSGIEIFLSGI